MLDLDLEQVDEASLQRLVTNQTPEGLRLEFKRELSLDTKEARREAAKDLSALANTAGGRILYGIEETELPDGSKVAGGIRPLTDGALEARLADVLVSAVHPRPRFATRQVPIAQGGFVLVAEAYDSIGRDLHMVSGYNEGRFYRRHSQGTYLMTEPEIREAYARIASSRADLEKSLEAQVQAELAFRATSLESFVIVPWFSSPHLIHPRQMASFKAWLRDRTLGVFGLNVEPHFQVYSTGFRAVMGNAAPADCHRYISVSKTGLIHFSSRGFGHTDGMISIISLLERFVITVEIARELLDRAAYWGPVRLIHAFRFPTPFRLWETASGYHGDFGEIPDGIHTHSLHEVQIKAARHSLPVLAKEFADQIFNDAGHPECPLFTPAGEPAPRLRDLLQAQSEDSPLRLLLPA